MQQNPCYIPTPHLMSHADARDTRTQSTVGIYDTIEEEIPLNGRKGLRGGREQGGERRGERGGEEKIEA